MFFQNLLKNENSKFAQKPRFQKKSKNLDFRILWPKSRYWNYIQKPRTSRLANCLEPNCH
jgi:hypothetical protein